MTLVERPAWVNPVLAVPRVYWQRLFELMSDDPRWQGLLGQLVLADGQLAECHRSDNR